MDTEFFNNTEHSTREGDTRRECITDALGHIEEYVELLKMAMGRDDLAAARKHFDEIKGWVDAIDDDLCERDEDGARIDD